MKGPGVVNKAVALQLVQPRRHGDYTRPLNIKESIYIEFDNGWTLEPRGDRLAICNPRRDCRDAFPGL